MNYPWIRVLKIRLSSKKTGKMTEIGGTGSSHLSITCKVNKYLCATKDSAEVRISNLTYGEIATLVTGQFYDVEIQAGYQNKGVQTIFKGGVLYISNALGDRKTNEVIILCASNLVAKFGQSKLSISLNSGINLYSAIDFIMRRAGIPSANINKSLKKEIALQYSYNMNRATAQNYLEYLQDTYEDIEISTDSCADSVITVASSTFDGSQFIKLNNRDINLAGGYPRLTNTGLNVTVVPTFNFMPGQILKVDNSLIDISVSSQSEMQKSYGNYLDKDGMYKIFEMEYDLANRASQFSLNLICKSKTMVEGG